MALTQRQQTGNNDLLEINRKIDTLYKKLGSLYLSRAGRVLWNSDGSVEEAWCIRCGREDVDVANGEDTCEICLHR